MITLPRLNSSNDPWSHFTYVSFGALPSSGRTHELFDFAEAMYCSQQNGSSTTDFWREKNWVRLSVRNNNKLHKRNILRFGSTHSPDRKQTRAEIIVTSLQVKRKFASPPRLRTLRCQTFIQVVLPCLLLRGSPSPIVRTAYKQK